MSARYAIFFSPDDTAPLASYGYRVLGRTATGESQPACADDFPDSAIAAACRATPAHYGFHATLKAPFHLAQYETVDHLFDAVETLAAQCTPVLMHTLAPRWMAGFMALVFEEQPESVGELAAQCVKQLDRFRAPLSTADLEKRRPDSLSEIQRGYLYQYGYPYVMSEFRFHMTLSGEMDAIQHADYIQWLHNTYKNLISRPPVLDRLCVFHQPDRSTPFSRLAQFPFA